MTLADSQIAGIIFSLIAIAVVYVILNVAIISVRNYMENSRGKKNE